MLSQKRENPTSDVNISFSRYVANRSQRFDSHLAGGIPDYAYASDFAMRQKIKAIPGAFAFFKAVTSSVVPMQKQMNNMNSVKVSPNQFPGLYAILRDCADTLGIGIPTMFVLNNIGELNASTYCLDDADPLIVIHSSLLERFTEQELKSVIGHECGHIHNNHGIYNTAVEVIKNASAAFIPGVGQILALLAQPVANALNAWSRAAEVSADRAGIICTGDLNSIETTNAKLASGAVLGAELNIDELVKQYDMLRATPVRMYEWLYNHPASVRRILAAREFFKSDVYYRWHPEQKKPNMTLYTKRELDEQCDKFVSVMKSERRRDR